MKKIIYSAAAALMLVGAASCEEGGSQNAKCEYFSESATDSLVQSFADLAGYSFAGQLESAMKQDSTITKEAFLKGLQYAFASDTTQAYMFGMSMGMQMQAEFNRYRQMGVNIDKSEWLNAFKKAFLADSVPGQLEMGKYQQDFQKWNDSLRAAKRTFDLAAIANSPEAKANLAEATKYVKDLQAKDAAVKVAPSGLAYKIDDAGAAEKITPTDRVVLKANVKALKGQNPPSIPSNPMPVAQLTKGLQEGLTMLGKGGKATFYVPGAMAYELDMAQRMGLEPNGLIIYEIEVLDVPAAPAQQMPGVAAQAVQPVKR